MLCKELILPRDFGNCTDIERSKAQPHALRGAAGRRPGARGAGPCFWGWRRQGGERVFTLLGLGQGEGGCRDREDEGKTRK